MRLPRPLAALVLAPTLAVAAVAAGPKAPRPPPRESIEPHRALFAYDEAAAFALEEKGREERGEALVRDVSFVAVPATGGRTAAYLVAPRSAPVRAAILWVHWLGEPATTNRTQFRDEAAALAGRGVVSLLPDTQWAQPTWYRDRVLEQDRAKGIEQVVALRRALDLLRAQPGVAGVPVALVGHDYGGMYGSIAAGLDGRLRTCVFIACTASLEDWAFYVKKPTSLDAYRAENRPLELRDYVAALKDVPVLCQFAEYDWYVPLAKAADYFAAAPGPKQMMVYGGADHDMTTPTAIRTDRTAWLVRELGL